MKSSRMQFLEKKKISSEKNSIYQKKLWSIMTSIFSWTKSEVAMEGKTNRK